VAQDGKWSIGQADAWAPPGGRAARRRIMETLRREASQKAVEGASAARTQDFLYNDDGLPE